MLMRSIRGDDSGNDSPKKNFGDIEKDDMGEDDDYETIKKIM
jgi:hypothetical protein